MVTKVNGNSTSTLTVAGLGEYGVSELMIMEVAA